jgi:allophanate hydrolase
VTDSPQAQLTLADWRAAWLAGAQPSDLLRLRRQLLQAHASDPAWIAQADDAQFEAQVARLQALADAEPDRAALLARLPLFGVPFAVKDNIDVAGIATTAACPEFAYVPGRHATTVQKLVDAGAVWVGKTNLDQFATGLVGTRSPYGRPASAFDAQRISGGSSSGSAVAVARGWVAFALGTDTAGSGRVPACFNHIVGLKPTPGRVSTAGVLPACRSLDCVSVFALTVDDAAAVMAVMEGPDAADIYNAVPAPSGQGPARLPARLRLGVPRDPGFFGDAAYAAGYAAAKARALELGHELVELDFAPLHAVADLLYSGPWVAERHAVVQPLLAERPQALDPTVRSVIEAALKFSATDAFRAQYKLRELAQKAKAVWDSVDVLFVPTTTGHPTFAEIDADPVGVNTRLGRYTNFVNLLGWCALALPHALGSDGLPFGVTLIAPGWHDAALARLGLAWQAAHPGEPLGATGRGHASAPAPAGLPFPASQPTLPIAVVGAHLSGMPLNGQLTERGATLREATHTAPRYRLYALPDTTPPKPGIKRVGAGETGHAIALEVWDVPLHAVGSFLALIPQPLGLGSVELADGRWVHGFICEGHVLQGARDVSRFGGWRAFVAALKAGTAGDAVTEDPPLNLPAVQAEVAEVFARYEAALAKHDLEALGSMFWQHDAVVRYGIQEIQHGAAAVAAFRAGGIAVGPNRRLERTVVTTFGRDVATVMTEFRDDGDPRLGRQSQTWVRLDGGWRVVAAHVSRMPQ